MKIVVFSTLVGLLFSFPLLACTCDLPKDADEEELAALYLYRSTVAFIGEVEEVVPGPVCTSTSFRRACSLDLVVFAVSEAWKGVSQSEFLISTRNEYSSCVYTFEVGTRYLVFGGEWNGVLQTHFCAGNGEVASLAERIRFMGPPVVSFEPE